MRRISTSWDVFYGIDNLPSFLAMHGVPTEESFSLAEKIFDDWLPKFDLDEVNPNSFDYLKGYDSGESAGYEEGYDDGYRAGYDDGLEVEY